MMEIDEDDILRNVAAGGSMDYSVWPALLPRLVSRIDKIAHHEFPIPNLPPPPSTMPPSTIPSSIPQSATQTDSEPAENFLSPLPSSPLEPPSSASSQDANKENTPMAPRPPAHPTSLSAPAVPLPPGTLPPQITDMLTEITTTLTSTFHTYPPHTIQRLSELVLTPKNHYRTLTSYLHAVDRVVHVTSGLNVYPLPPVHAEFSAVLPNGISDGVPAPSPFANPGGDEALGGALLTPIPWLQPSQHAVTTTSPPPQTAQPASTTATPESSGQTNSELEGEVRTESTETIEGPNGVGSVETVSVSVNGIPSMGARGVGVTQGELLRQEQKAGVVPVSQLVPSHHVHPGGASAAQQQQMQARLQAAQHQQLQQARAHALSQSPSPDQTTPDSSASAQTGTSTPSSATLEADENAETMAEGGLEPAPTLDDAPIISVRTNNAEDEDKPHARGPEEIGADDLGPQSASNTASMAQGGPSSVVSHGIDIQAAVGRKAVSPPKHEEEPEQDDKMDVRDDPTKEDDGDQMDVDAKTTETPAQTEDTPRPERAGTPKREAEEDLEGIAKKLKEDSETVDVEIEQGKGREEGKEDGDAMDEA
ncbi:hypothetical protein F5Y15DRAFT_97089 [Xylariaceae sp. FL0016]|nr:hypothetical protein F5Y15DRAFT_97089 [Xylariaceae sp. FL0016]